MRILLSHHRAWLAGLALALLWLPVSAADPVADNKALVVVKLPAGAKLIFDEKATQQTGAERQFITPSLAPGKTYYYNVKATWTEGGQEKTVSRDVVVKAGQRVDVDLNTGAAVAEAPKKDPPKVVDKPKIDEAKPAAAKSRTFLFTYSTTVTDLPADKTARVWLPMPTSSDDQEVKLEDDKGLPAGYKIEKEPTYGNSMIYAEVKGDKDGKATLEATYRVTRKEVKGASAPEVADAKLLDRYLQPDKLVPLEGKPLELIKGKKVPEDQVAASKMLYDVVNQHVKYGKDVKGWGRGDVNWVCDAKTGNCTDFHSLFISLARANKIPSKFEIGFSIPTKRGAGDIGGYHCWAFFKPEGKGWMAVDISEANKDPKMTDYYFGNLTEDRVTFTTGRDYDLAPKQDGETRNFFIYPYAEVDGKEYPADKVKRKFAYKDLPG
jgi:uncharacterized protein (TIGR03000 family)